MLRHHLHANCHRWPALIASVPHIPPLPYPCSGVLSDSTLVYLTSAYCEPVPVPVPPSSPQPATAVTTVPEQASAAWSQAQQQQLSLQQSQQHLLQQQQQQLGEVQHRLAAVTLVADTAVREPSRDQQLAAARTVQSRLAGATGTARLRLLNAPRRAEAPLARDVVHVHTNDGEWFPVAKRLLRPCISLTKAVRDSGVTSPAVHVDIDTCTMDRVLLFLEAAATQRQPPRFAAHMLCDLARAAEQLGLRSLVRYCAALQGSRAALLGVYTFAQVQAANAAGKVWLILDGMVLDVGRWLPEHPGGAAIIPAQALNVDCGRFFEVRVLLQPRRSRRLHKSSARPPHAARLFIFQRGTTQNQFFSPMPRRCFMPHASRSCTWRTFILAN
jgi:Cytochrome b5-like Heme/Steroid binding domain